MKPILINKNTYFLVIKLNEHIEKEKIHAHINGVQLKYRYNNHQVEPAILLKVKLQILLTRISASLLGPGKPFTTISFDMYPVPPFQFFDGLSTV